MVRHFGPKVHPGGGSGACQTQGVTVELNWAGDLRFDAEVPSGCPLPFDSADEPEGTSPMETFLASLAACMAMDVISILKKSRNAPKRYRVTIEADRNPPGEWPRPFENVRITHVVTGEVDEAALERAIELSQDKYCSVSATLRTSPEITNTWRIE